MRLPSSETDGAITWRNYTEPGGGESGYIAVSRKPPYTVFGGGIGSGSGHGRLLALNPQTGQKRNVTVWPEVLIVIVGDVAAAELKYRFQWTFPVDLSLLRRRCAVRRSNCVHRSSDEGTSRGRPSVPTSRATTRTSSGASGGPITARQQRRGDLLHDLRLRESPHQQGVFWAGSDDGLIHFSRDGGAIVAECHASPTLPEWALISVIEPSPHDPATAYVAATRYKHDDTAPYLFKTNDYGATWTRITNGIPEPTIHARHPRGSEPALGLLFVGTELGVYVSFDDGGNWQPFQCNLPSHLSMT